MQDVKFMKRYISVCTPDALKFKESRKRALQREFAPRDLPEKDIFTQNKAAEILERRRLKVLQKDMRKAKTQVRPLRDADSSEQYSVRNKSTMPRIDLGFQRRGNNSVLQRSVQPEVTELSEEDEV